jgi:type IV secretion system protein VirB5
MAKKTGNGVWVAGVLALFAFTPRVHAQWAVVDVGAIGQLVQEVKLMQQELQTAQNDLTQARQAYQSMTGSRGMQSLLSGTPRNYLPANWSQVQSAINGTSGTYAALSSNIQANIGANTVLSPSALALMSPTERLLIQSQRQNTALLQALTQQALSTTSSRFSSIQQLINTIGSASDPKAILDLQARISAEQGMLATDESKLQTLYQAAQAQEAARQSRAHEQAIVDAGSLRQLPPMRLP